MSPPGAEPGPDGLLVVDKPADWTSHDVVARLRRAAGTRRVGHAGTLDPMATGVLVVGLGWSTKLLTHVVGVDKDYDATIRLGVATLTDDAQGEVTATADASGVQDVAIERAVGQLTGPISQVPSSVSAIKVAGQRAYARVRAGEQVALAPREVVVSRFQISGRHRAPTTVDLQVSITCSSGTYVRALARDLGAALGVGGHLTALRRTRVGPFDLADSTELAALTGTDHPLRASLLAPAAAAEVLFDRVRLPESALADLRHGRPVDWPAPGSIIRRVAAAGTGNPSRFKPPDHGDDPPDHGDDPPDRGVVAVVDGSQLVALARRDGSRLRPVTVVPAPIVADNRAQ